MPAIIQILKSVSGSFTGTYAGAIVSASVAATSSYFSGSVVFPSGLGVTGSITLLTGDLVVGSAGNGLSVKGGANSKIGTVTLTAGSASVSTTAVTANSIVLYSVKAISGTVGHLRYVVNAGTSVLFISDQAADSSTLVYMIVEAT